MFFDNFTSQSLLPLLLTLHLVSVAMTVRFTKEPRNASVAEGAEGSLDCVFDSPVSSCYWNKDEGNVEIGNGRYQWTQRSGTISADCTIRISGAQMKLDDGAWECGTPQTDQQQGIHSKKAYFTVMTPPNDPVILSNGVEQANESSIAVDFKLPPAITCLSTMGNPSASLSWQLGATSIRGQTTITNTTNPKIKRVELNITQPMDESWKDGRLTCISDHPSYSTGGQHFADVYIRIPYATTTVTAFSGNGTTGTTISVDNTEWLALNCTADGFPVPKFRWERREDDSGQWQFYRDGQNITFQAFSSQFQCVATNDNFGSEIRSAQILTVNTDSSRSAQIGLIIGIIVIVLLLVVFLVAGVFTLYKKKKWPFKVPDQEERNVPENNALAPPEVPQEPPQLRPIPEEEPPAERKHLIGQEEQPSNGAKPIRMLRNFIVPRTIHAASSK